MPREGIEVADVFRHFGPAFREQHAASLSSAHAARRWHCAGRAKLDCLPPPGVLPANRLLSIDDGKVCFRWKDYRDDNRQKTMTLSGDEFIRRFLIHVLPDGFHRIRYFGFLGNCHRAQKLRAAGNSSGWRRPDRRSIRRLITATVSRH